MNYLRWLAAAALIALLLPRQERSADPTRETNARTTLELAAGQEVSLKYRTLAWSSENARLMRQKADVRSQMNQRWQLGGQTEFKIPIALSLNGRRLEPETYRIGLVMNDAGAFELGMLLEHDTVRFPVDLSESKHFFPYLTYSLLPSEDGLFALVFQWGSEHGRVLFTLPR